MKDIILRKLTGYRDEMARLAAELVAIPTENPPGDRYRDCIELLAAELERLGLTHRIHEVSGHAPPRYWLESYYGEGHPTLYFHGHYDVVPASREEQFRPRIAAGKLYGRGSSDMKGGLAAMVYAVKALDESGARFSGRVGLVFVPDEETGGDGGSVKIAEAGLLGRDGVGMMTAEPTGGVIWNASRGAISLRVRVKGSAVTT
jgi:acetylornithine deacetylase/succinyl-diaminopimelate desuccinylase-like protein